MFFFPILQLQLIINWAHLDEFWSIIYNFFLQKLNSFFQPPGSSLTVWPLQSSPLADRHQGDVFINMMTIMIMIMILMKIRDEFPPTLSFEPQGPLNNLWGTLVQKEKRNWKEKNIEQFQIAKINTGQLRVFSFILRTFIYVESVFD